MSANVTVYLNTPLIRPDSDDDLPTNIYRLKGRIIENDSSGLTLQVKEIGDEKGWDKTPAFKKIFLPQHKIDFIDFE